MFALVPYIFCAALALAFPSLFKYFFFAPLLGFGCGGFAWGIAICFFPMLMTFKVLGVFMIVATVAMGFIAAKLD